MLPEVDDDFAKDLGEFETLDQLKAPLVMGSRARKTPRPQKKFGSRSWMRSLGEPHGGSHFHRGISNGQAAEPDPGLHDELRALTRRLCRHNLRLIGNIFVSRRSGW